MIQYVTTLTSRVCRLSVRRMMSLKLWNPKPLNILVLTGKNCPTEYKDVEQNMFKCVSSSDYLIYQILDLEILRQPWMESTHLLVITSKIISDSEAAVLEKYLESSGKILLICSKFKDFAGFKCIESSKDADSVIQIKNLNSCDLPILRGKYVYSSGNSDILFKDNCNNPIIQKATISGGILITSEVYIDRNIDCKKNNFPTAQSFPSDHLNKLGILKMILTEYLGLKPACEAPENNLSDGFCIFNHENYKSAFFGSITVEYKEEQVGISIFYYDKSVHSVPFNTELYFSSLNTESYGQQLIYFQATTSTMEIAEKLPVSENAVIFASMQLGGKGRGLNKWISPSGCASFTLCFEIDIRSNLGQRLSMIQHMAALAVVHGIRSNKHYEDLNIKIKWPNDIYYDRFKIGGLLVTSALERNIARIKIGWGINVFNSSPTVCLNDIIRMHNENVKSQMPDVQIEEVVAFTVSKMAYFVKNFQNLGPDETLFLYYSYWMHGNQEVTVQQLDKKGVICGLDEHGFLIVKTTDGNKISLQPDGNRFDISKNLIFAK